MKKGFLIVLLAVSVFVLQGCISVVKTDSKCPQEESSYSSIEGSSATSTMFDIDMIRDHFSLPIPKTEAYQAIAQRALTQDERAYLVETVTNDSSLSAEYKDSVLLQLAERKAYYKSKKAPCDKK